MLGLWQPDLLDHSDSVQCGMLLYVVLVCCWARQDQKIRTSSLQPVLDFSAAFRAPGGPRVPGGPGAAAQFGRWSSVELRIRWQMLIWSLRSVVWVPMEADTWLAEYFYLPPHPRMRRVSLYISYLSLFRVGHVTHQGFGQSSIAWQ